MRGRSAWALLPVLSQLAACAVVAGISDVPPFDGSEPHEATRADVGMTMHDATIPSSDAPGGKPPPHDGGRDTGPDAPRVQIDGGGGIGTDSGHDTGLDGAQDTGADTGHDSGIDSGLHDATGGCTSGALECVGQQPRVCDEGGWVDNGAACAQGDPCCNGACKANDVDNCGACGTTCSGSCTAGECLVTLATAVVPQAIVVDTSENVYFTTANTGGSTGTIVKHTASPPSLVTLAVGRADPVGLALDTLDVYWVDYGGGTVEKTAQTGTGAVVTLASGQNNPIGIAVAGGVYWDDEESAGTVKRVTTAGASLATLASSQPTPSGITVVDSTVYWTNNTGNDVCSTPSGGMNGIVVTIAPSQASPVAITSDTRSVYWVDSGPMSSIVKYVLSTGVVSTLASGMFDAFSIATDGTNVYWTSRSATGGDVYRVAVTGGGVTTMATGQDDLYGIAVGDKSVYWTTSLSAGSVVQLTPK
jgi:hypothetical protein